MVSTLFLSPSYFIDCRLFVQVPCDRQCRRGQVLPAPPVHRAEMWVKSWRLSPRVHVFWARSQHGSRKTGSGLPMVTTSPCVIAIQTTKYLLLLLDDVEVTPPTSTRNARVAGCIRAWLLCLWSQPETYFTNTEVEASRLHAWWSSHLSEGVVSPQAPHKLLCKYGVCILSPVTPGIMPAHLMKCVYTASVVILYSYLILHGNFAESHRNVSVQAMHITWKFLFSNFFYFLS